MANLTELTRGRVDSSSLNTHARPKPVQVAQTPSNGNAATTRGDRLVLTNAAQNVRQDNPYQQVAPDYIKVKVGRWGSGDNDSLIGILRAQNYSKSEIYSKDSEGLTMLDRVSQANKLKNPNLIREGQELTIPVKERQQANGEQRVETNTTPQTNTNATPSSSNSNEQTARIQEVRVGKWGQDKNGSLYEILRNQGFTRQQILDGDADSVLNKVARANGLADPNKIQEGATLRVPNSMEALNQMEVPEANNGQTRRRETRIPEIQPRPVEIRPIELPKVEIPPIQPIEPKNTGTNEANTTTNNNSTSTTGANTTSNSRGTANMGLLLDGVKSGNFTREEFQYLNALSNRYEETRSQFSRDGFSDDELKALGNFETRYGVNYTRLYNSDEIKLSNATSGESTNPKTQVRLRHYQEGGTIWDGFQGGTLDSEAAIAAMIAQRAEARAQGEK